MFLFCLPWHASKLPAISDAPHSTLCPKRQYFVNLERRKGSQIYIINQIIKRNIRLFVLLAVAHLEMRDAVIRAFMQDQISAQAGWQNMIVEIFAIYR